ncbi:MAG: PHB depolymerase family esterase [Kosmotogaceae bacterium]
MKTGYLIILATTLLIAILMLANNKTLDYNLYLSHNGIERRSIVHVPDKIVKEKLPLVIVFHGLFGNSTYTKDTYGITELSDKKGFISVYPEGTGQLDNALLSWNVEFCCGYAMENKIDDVGYITELLTLIKQRYNVDNDRIYLIGFSNGGMLTYKLISEHPELFTAAAIVSSSPSGGSSEGSIIHIEPPKKSFPLIIFHGERDTIIPYHGGFSGEENSSGIFFSSILESVERWANSMDALIVEENFTDQEKVIVRKYLNENNHVIIEFYTLKEEGHTFPGRIKGFQSFFQENQVYLDAKELIWDFFESHSN